MAEHKIVTKFIVTDRTRKAVLFDTREEAEQYKRSLGRKVYISELPWYEGGDTMGAYQTAGRLLRAIEEIETNKFLLLRNGGPMHIKLIADGAKKVESLQSARRVLGRNMDLLKRLDTKEQ